MSTADDTPAMPAPHEPLPYATEARPAPRLGALITIFFCALALVVLGGCFLIGVLMLVTQDTGGGRSTRLALMVALYLMAFACFGGAIFFFVLGVRWALRILHT